MRNFLLKLLGVDLTEIKEYLRYKQEDLKEEKVIELFEIEKTMSQYMVVYHNDFFKLLRCLTSNGFPTERYRKLSEEFGLSDEKKYNKLKRKYEKMSK